MRNVKINLFEVGDIFLTVNNINPGTRFGGTWELIAKGRTLVGVDPNDSDFNVVEKTGGSKYLERHRHGIANMNSGGAGGYGGMTTFGFTAIGWGDKYDAFGYGTSSEGTGDSGNLQPYFTCYIWCRTT